MQRRDADRIAHMREAAEKAVRLAGAHDRSDLETDEVLRLAMTKLVEIVGEAAKQVSDDARLEHSHVPWSAAARMRDRLVHHYFDINLDVLWRTVTEELPPLVDQLNDIEIDPD